MSELIRERKDIVLPERDVVTKRCHANTINVLDVTIKRCNEALIKDVQDGDFSVTIPNRRRTHSFTNATRRTAIDTWNR